MECCKACGTQNNADAVFCGNCGARLQSVPMLKIPSDSDLKNESAANTLMKQQPKLWIPAAILFLLYACLDMGWRMIRILRGVALNTSAYVSPVTFALDMLLPSAYLFMAILLFVHKQGVQMIVAIGLRLLFYMMRYVFLSGFSNPIVVPCTVISMITEIALFLIVRVCHGNCSFFRFIWFIPPILYMLGFLIWACIGGEYGDIGPYSYVSFLLHVLMTGALWFTCAWAVQKRI